MCMIGPLCVNKDLWWLLNSLIFVRNECMLLSDWAFYSLKMRKVLENAISFLLGIVSNVFMKCFWPTSNLSTSTCAMFFFFNLMCGFTFLSDYHKH